MRNGTCTKTPPVIPSPITCVTALALVIRRHASGIPIRSPFQGNFLSRTHLGSRVVNPIYIFFGSNERNDHLWSVLGSSNIALLSLLFEKMDHLNTFKSPLHTRKWCEFFEKNHVNISKRITNDHFDHLIVQKLINFVHFVHLNRKYIYSTPAVLLRNGGLPAQAPFRKKWD